MCIDGNSAPLSVRYLNAQLTALWQNAVECVKYAEHHGASKEVHLTSQDYDRHKYQRALAQFHYVGKQRAGGSIQKEDLFFNASFAQPRLEFICNHEAALYLKVEKGHFNKAFTKSLGAGSKLRIDRSENVPIEGFEIAYRMKFTQSAIEGHDSRIGHGKGYTIQLMILDFENAELVMFRPNLADEVKQALKFYLGQYIQFLTDGGQNCLLNLPDFDDDAYSPVIDYSLTTKAIEDELCNDVLVHGNSVEDINEHLRRVWLQVAVLENPPADKFSLLLTEFQSNWLSDSESHFHVHFGPPTVRALCSHEVVVYYNVDEIIFYDSAELRTVRETFSGWRIAFIVSVLEERLSSDVVILKLDFDTARFCHHLSFFSSTNVNVNVYTQELIEFMTTVYVDLVVQYECTVLWRNDVVVVFPLGDGTSALTYDGYEDIVEVEDTEITTGTTTTTTTTTTEKKTVATVIKEKTTCYHYDQMVTVSEETVNRVFATWWLTAKKSAHINVLYRYEVEAFKVTFEQPRIQLLSGGRALVWITVGSGKMIVDGREAVVGGWRIAVECKLKMVEHKHLGVDQGWFGRFKETVFGQSQDTTKTIQHVVLDIDSATIIRELCVFDGMFDAGAKLAVLRTRAIEQHIIQYMRAFAQAGYHIVHSTPIYGAEAEFGWTSVDFRVVSRTDVSVTNVTHKHEAPVIVVVGMMRERPLPAVTTIEWHEGLVIRSKKISYGTVTLASKSFLQRAILDRLVLINAKTTIVPRFPRADEEEWKVYLCSWDEHTHRKIADCRWKQVAGSNALTSSALEYAWHHKDVWTYERHGTLEAHGSYNVECETTNRLRLPTNFRSGGMDIVVSGKTSLRLKSATDAQQWSRSSTASWSATIHVTSHWDGLHVRLAQVIKPEIHSEKVLEHGQSAIAINTQEMLQAHMPQIVDFSAIVADLKATLEGTWRYAVAGLSTYRLYSPVFNIHGDLVVQVRPYDPFARPPPAPMVLQPADGPLIRQSTRGSGGSRSRTVSRAEEKQRTSLFDLAKEFVHDVVRGENHEDHGAEHKHEHKRTKKAELPSISRTVSTASTTSVSSTSSAASTTSAHSVRTIMNKSGTSPVTAGSPAFTAVVASNSVVPTNTNNGHANGHANEHKHNQ